MFLTRPKRWGISGYLKHPLAMKYPTLDDWHYNQLEIRVPIIDTGDADFNFLIFLHGLVEAHLCRKRGIKGRAVEIFDAAHRDADEPGDLPDAPYHREHQQATDIEKVVCQMLNISWEAYEQTLNQVFDKAFTGLPVKPIPRKLRPKKEKVQP